MNTIQLGSITTQIDISKYVKETVEAQPEQQVEVETQISNDIPARGTKQYDELKAALTNAKVPVTDENIKTANLMIKSGIEVQKENIEAAADIKGQLEYIINHANEDSVKSIIDNKISLEKITMDILENVIKDVSKNKISSKTAVSKEEVKKETDKYIKENDLKDKEEIDNVSKCIENLLQQGLPVTDKNVQALESVISKSEEIKSADKDIVLNLLKKGKDNTIENIYVSKFSSNKKYSTNKKVDDKTWKELLPQVEKLVDNPKFENKQKAIDAAKLLLENEIPITEENISEITDIEKLQSDGIDTDKLLEEAVKNLKADKSVSDIDLNKVIKDTSSNETVVSNKPNKQVSKTKQNDIANKSTPQRDIVEYDIKKQQYEQIVKEIQQYDDEVINKVLDSGGDLTLKNLHMALEQLKQQDKTEETPKEHNKVENSQLTNEQKKELKENIEKELKTVTAKRQLAEIQLRLTSEAMSTLMQKGIDIDTMPLKDVVDQLKSIEKDLYKTHLEIAGAEVNDENIGAMKDLYDKLSDITDLSAPTYQQVVHKDIPFTITDLSDAEQINTNSQLLQLQQASDTYENLQTQPNPKFKESFSKVVEQVEPLLNDLGIEATDENIRATKILVKNKMEVNEENILDIKLIDTKVSEVTTQLHPTIAANMIRDGLKPAQMHIDDVIKYMNKFEDLLGEDLSEKISSYIYEMDKAGELTQPERETMIGIYRMLYTIDKTQGRATGFVVKNDMDLTLNNLMEAANYYDRTNARYTDIDVKIDDKFGAIDKVIVNEKSIKAQLNKAYENNTNENKKTDETNNKEVTSLTQVDLNDKDTSIKTVAKNISLNDAIKLVKSNDNVLNEAIKQLPKYIERNSTLIQNSEISNQPHTDEPLANLDIDHVIEATNNIKTLTAKNKEDIVKIYNTLRNIQTSDDKKLDIDKTLNDVNKELENIKKDTESNIKVNLNPVPKIVISKSSEIKNIINTINIDDIVKLSNNESVENISIDEIKNYINKNLESKISISDMSENEILKQIDSLPKQTKEMIIDIKKAATTIASADTKTLDELSKNIQSFKLNDLIKETKNIETLKSVDKLIQNVDINSINTLKSSDILNMDIDSVLESIKENRQQSTDTKPLIEYSIDEVLSYINKEDIQQEQKDTVLKLYNTFNTIQNSDNKVLKEVDSDVQLSINKLSDLVDKFKDYKQTEETSNTTTKNEITHLLQKLTFEDIKNITRQDEDISNVDLNKLEQSTKETEQTPIAQMNTTELINYIKSDNTLKQKDNIVKIYDLINTVSNFDEESIVNLQDIKTIGDLETEVIAFKQSKHEAKSYQQKENDLKEFIQKIDLDKVTRLVKEHSDVENIPIAKVVEDIDKMPVTKHSELIKIDRNDIVNYIKKSDLNTSQKELAVKIADTIKNIADETDIELPAKEEVTVNTLIEADRVKQNKEVIKKLVQNIDLDKLTNLTKKENDLENISIAKVVENIDKMPVTKQPELIKISRNEVINYINKSDLSTSQKELAIKIADTLKNIADKPDIELPPIDKKEMTINTLETIDKIEQIKHSVDEFIMHTDLNKLSTLVRKYSDIETVPIAQLTKEIEIQQTDTKNNLENIDITKVFEYINKSKTLSQQQKDNILKVANTVSDLLNTDMKSVETIERDNDEINLVDLKQSVNNYIEQEDLKFTDAQNKNVLNNFINSITPDRLVKLMKKHSSLTKVAVKDIVNDENISSKVAVDIYNDTEKLKDYVKSTDLTLRQKETFINVANSIDKIKSSENDILILDSDFTLDDLVNQIQQKKNVEAKDSTNDRARSENIKDTLNEFIQKADSQTVSKLVEQYPELESLSVNKVVDYMNNIKDSRLNFIGKNVPNRVAKNILQDTFTISNEVEKIINTVEAVKNLDINTVVDMASKEVKDLTLDKLINIVEDMNETGKANETSLNNLSTTEETAQVEKLNGYETKQDEYNRTLLTKFIQSAEPEVMSKVIKQYSTIDNIPIENLLKSMELVQADKASNTKGATTNNDSNKVKEFLESLNKISKTEPATMLWMQKQNIPLTINNIEVVQNFVKNPFWLGEQLNKLSKDLKDKFGEQKDISKAVSKKNLSALKDGKTATNLLEDLEEEIVKAKKEIIKLPEQERQSLWKQSSNLEKAIELQKQIQKDEMIYQIPMQLHNGLTNMNLYVMNDREGNGKSVNDEMKVFLAMNTETLGTVQIYMRMSEKSVSFQINSDNPEATKFLQGQQVALQSSIENLGYMVNKMQYGQEQRKSPLQSQIQSQIKPSGKNISDDGFEAII